MMSDKEATRPAHASKRIHCTEKDPILFVLIFWHASGRLRYCETVPSTE